MQSWKFEKVEKKPKRKKKKKKEEEEEEEEEEERNGLYPENGGKFDIKVRKI